MARTACLVCFTSTVNSHCNKKKEEAYPWKASASSRHTTNLKQSILRLSISMAACHNHRYIREIDLSRFAKNQSPSTRTLVVGTNKAGRLTRQLG
jgi:hypothetical protein